MSMASIYFDTGKLGSFDLMELKDQYDFVELNMNDELRLGRYKISLKKDAISIYELESCEKRYGKIYYLADHIYSKLTAGEGAALDIIVHRKGIRVLHLSPDVKIMFKIPDVKVFNDWNGGTTKLKKYLRDHANRVLLVLSACNWSEMIVINLNWYPIAPHTKLEFFLFLRTDKEPWQLWYGIGGW